MFYLPIGKIRLEPQLMECMIRYFLAFLFLYSGGLHELAPSAFARSVQRYQLDPFISPYVVAEVLPKLEILVGIFLLVDIWIEIFYPISVGLFVLFSLAMAIALARGQSIDCGCFGSGSFQISWWHVGANLILGTLAWTAVRYRIHKGTVR